MTRLSHIFHKYAHVALCTIFFTSYLSGLAYGDEPKEKPPLDFSLLLGEIGGAIVIGSAGAVATGYLARDLSDCGESTNKTNSKNVSLVSDLSRLSGQFDCFPAFFSGLPIGASLGAATGAIIVARLGGQKSKYTAVYTFAFLGGVISSVALYQESVLGWITLPLGFVASIWTVASTRYTISEDDADHSKVKLTNLQLNIDPQNSSLFVSANVQW